MAVVGLGPAYECRAESEIGDGLWLGVNAGVTKAILATKSHKKCLACHGNTPRAYRRDADIDRTQDFFVTLCGHYFFKGSRL
jgi:hypothetical protein